MGWKKGPHLLLPGVAQSAAGSMVELNSAGPRAAFVHTHAPQYPYWTRSSGFRIQRDVCGPTEVQLRSNQPYSHYGFKVDFFFFFPKLARFSRFPTMTMHYFCFYFHYSRRWVIDNLALIYVIECSPYVTFRSLIHLEFIFVYGVRKCSNFILLHVAVQFSQHHFLKRLSLPHCIFLPPLSKIRYP